MSLNWSIHCFVVISTWKGSRKLWTLTEPLCNRKIKINHIFVLFSVIVKAPKDSNHNKTLKQIVQWVWSFDPPQWLKGNLL